VRIDEFWYDEAGTPVTGDSRRVEGAITLTDIASFAAKGASSRHV
jgi:hypothetical protein